jgi:hypothetical protein
VVHVFRCGAGRRHRRLPRAIISAPL